MIIFFFFQAEDGIRDLTVTGVQTCALPIWSVCARQGTNTPIPLRRSPPDSFKRLLGSTFPLLFTTRHGAARRPKVPTQTATTISHTAKTPNKNKASEPGARSPVTVTSETTPRLPKDSGLLGARHHW